MSCKSEKSRSPFDLAIHVYKKVSKNIPSITSYFRRYSPRSRGRRSYERDPRHRLSQEKKEKENSSDDE